MCRVITAAAAAFVTGSIAHPSAQAPPERIDYLTFGQGAIPLEVAGAGASLGVTMEKAIMAIDGDHGGFPLSLKTVPADGDTVFLYELPAPTTFDRFAVPNVLETPSPAQTFTKRVEIFGSSSSRESGFSLLASGDLVTHKGRGEFTELLVTTKTPVRWIRVRLVGGIDVQREQSFFEFSEIIGNGTQETPALVNHFSGAWLARGIQIGLRQSGAAVSGCYDGTGTLAGTVTGNLLRAAGVDSVTGVKSFFLLNVVDGRILRGLRSTNGAPFRLYTADSADPSAIKCTVPGAPTLGCGSVIHGISFDFDSATIRKESDAVLTMLYEGLNADPSSAIVIEGHTSSEGTDDYNQRLSERRAASVVADLTRRGIAAGRLSAAGAGESKPIATNADESGRSLNRRVEVRCGSGSTFRSF